MANSLERHINIIWPQVPKGIRLVERVCELSIRSIIDTYSLLKKAPFREKLLTSGQICFRPLDQIRTMQRMDRPPDAFKLLYPTMECLGIPKHTIEADYYHLTPEYPVYQNPDSEKLTITFSDETLTDLSVPDPDLRGCLAVIFGRALIRKILETLPIPHELTPQAEWKTMIKTGMTDFIAPLAIKFPEQVKPENFAILKKNVDDLPILDPKASVLAYGALVSFLFDGQTQNTAEYSMGREFNAGIICYLAQDAIQQFIILMEKAQIASDSIKFSNFYADVLSPTDSQRYAVGILRNMQGIDFADKNRLLELYLNSELPVYHHNSKQKGPVNPWQYPR